jgi:hypothetical protein
MPNGRTAWTLAVSRPEALASRDEEDRVIRGMDHAAAVQGLGTGCRGLCS